jgi:hypothetical protein
VVALAVALVALVVAGVVLLLRRGGPTGAAAEVAKPPSPIGVRLAAQDADKLDVQWDEVPNVTGYAVFYRKPGRPPKSVEVAKDFSATEIDGLDPASRYCVQTVSLRDKTQSSRSQEQCAGTGAPGAKGGGIPNVGPAPAPGAAGAASNQAGGSSGSSTGAGTGPGGGASNATPSPGGPGGGPPGASTVPVQQFLAIEYFSDQSLAQAPGTTWQAAMGGAAPRLVDVAKMPKLTSSTGPLPQRNIGYSLFYDFATESQARDACSVAPTSTTTCFVARKAG